VSAPRHILATGATTTMPVMSKGAFMVVRGVPIAKLPSRKSAQPIRLVPNVPCRVIRVIGAPLTMPVMLWEADMDVLLGWTVIPTNGVDAKSRRNLRRELLRKCQWNMWHWWSFLVLYSSCVCRGALVCGQILLARLMQDQLPCRHPL